MILRRLGDSLTFSRVAWDSETFEFPVYALEEWSTSSPEAYAHLDEGWTQDLGGLDSGERVMLTARVPASNRRIRSALEALSFVAIEWTLHPRINLSSWQELKHLGVEIRIANSFDEGWVMKEAENAFTISRYFADRHIDRSHAQLRFRNWVSSAFHDENKQVLVFEASSTREPIAFFVVTTIGDRAFLELTAVTERNRGRGFSMAAWSAYLNFALEHGIREVSTNISAENSNVIGIYPRLGFRFSEPSVVYHAHFGAQFPSLLQS